MHQDGRPRRAGSARGYLGEYYLGRTAGFPIAGRDTMGEHTMRTTDISFVQLTARIVTEPYTSALARAGSTLRKQHAAPSTPAEESYEDALARAAASALAKRVPRQSP